MHVRLEQSKYLNRLPSDALSVLAQRSWKTVSRATGLMD
jgi:hypothetical protein